MPKWEYQTIMLKRKYNPGGLLSSAHLTDWNQSIDFQKLGDEGWELVSAIPIADLQMDYSGCTHQIQYIFKRPKG